MFKPVREDEALNGKHGMRTRRCKDQGSNKNRGKKDRQAASSPDNIDSPTNSSTSSKDIAGRKSPSTVSTCSNSSTDKDKIKKTSNSPLKGRKRPLEEVDSEKQKRQKGEERPDSAGDSSSDSSSVCGNDNDEIGNEGDIENNQEDDLSSSSESPVPSPIPAEVEEESTKFKPVEPAPRSPVQEGSNQVTAQPVPTTTAGSQPVQLPQPLPAAPVAIPVLTAAPVVHVIQPIPHPTPTPPRASPTPVLLPASERERLLMLERQREFERKQEADRLGGSLDPRQRQDVKLHNEHNSKVEHSSAHHPPPLQPASHHPGEHRDLEQQREAERLREVERLREIGDRHREFERQREAEFRQREYERHRELNREGEKTSSVPTPTTTAVTTDQPREVDRLPHGLAPHLNASLPPPPPLQGLVKPILSSHASPHAHPSHPTPPPLAPPLTAIKQEVIECAPPDLHQPKPPHHRPGLSPPPPLLSQHHPRHTPPPHHPHLPPHPYHQAHMQPTSTPPHLLPGHAPPPHSPHVANNHLSSSSSAMPPIQIKQERPATPPHSHSPLPPHSSRPKSPVKSQSPPPRPRSRSPLISRSRSRSPVSSPEPERRSPSPEPRIINEQCHNSANAIFLRRIWRGYNSCARCDIESRPLPDSKLARKREERLKRAQHAAAPPFGGSLRPPSVPSKEEKRVEPTPTPPSRKEEDKKRLETRVETPPLNPTADAQVTSTLMVPHQAIYANDRATPGRMGPYPQHDPTPALRQLSEYARPHALANRQPGEHVGYVWSSDRTVSPVGDSLIHPLLQGCYTNGQAAQERGMPMGLGPGGPGNPGMDPMLHYRMASMYPPGSRERLELELQRDKQERDARERDLRERELRDMEFREKMKQELEMKPPGFDRLPPGAQIDPHWLEIQRRYGGMPPGAGPHGHIPGVYPPASIASDLIQRERERIERIDAMQHPPPHPPPSNNRNLMLYEYYQRQATLDPNLQRHMNSLYPISSTAKAELEARPEASHLVYHFSRADPLAAAAAAQGGHASHQLMAAREQEMMYRELLSRPPYSTDPVLAHQVLSAQAAQHEALQRQIAMEREGLARHLPPH